MFPISITKNLHRRGCSTLAGPAPGQSRRLFIFQKGSAKMIAQAKPKTCIVPGCFNASVQRGVCSRCYSTAQKIVSRNGKKPAKASK